MIDFARKPGRQQAVKLNLFEVILRRLCYLLAQKGIQMCNSTKCGYCGNPVKSEEVVKSTLLYRNGAQLARKEKNTALNVVLRMTRWPTRHNVKAQGGPYVRCSRPKLHRKTT